MIIGCTAMHSLLHLAKQHYLYLRFILLENNLLCITAFLYCEIERRLNSVKNA
jgi:hypothetical protein